jgi:hypothetical protein
MKVEGEMSVMTGPWPGVGVVGELLPHATAHRQPATSTADERRTNRYEDVMVTFYARIGPPSMASHVPLPCGGTTVTVAGASPHVPPLTPQGQV